MQGHARSSNLELAEAASLSAAQCHRRHRRLEELGFVSRYQTRLDAARLGRHRRRVIHVSMERGHIRELPKFKDVIGDLPEVLECYSVTGDFDYVIKVITRDLPALSRFLMDTLMKLPGVRGRALERVHGRDQMHERASASGVISKSSCALELRSAPQG